MKKNKVIIMLDIWAGPIWGCTYSEKDGKYEYDIDIIAEDSRLMKLHQQIQDLYSSYYHFNYHGSACYFDESQARKDKNLMLKLLSQLKERLNDINDGSFEVEDRETKYIEML